jgi:hypothetical protein
MWGSLLGLALLISLNPMLLGMILLVISRPRPVQNLFVYWLGTMLMNLPLFLVPLALLHMTPGFASFADGIASSAEAPPGVIRPAPLVLAVVLLAMAAVMARPRVRERANLPAGGGGDSSTMVLESDEPPPNSGPLGHAKNTAVKAVSAIQRMYGRLLNTWENGSLWVALVFGMMYLPSATLVLLIDTTIVASGAGIGEQVIAAIAFVVGYLAVLEIVLISYLVAPERTEVLLRPLHEWARIHNRHILFVFFVLIAIWQLARGFSLA